ncbi:MAG TPA: hypothetical protein VF625_10745, partial [Longimicrobium sp.]
QIGGFPLANAHQSLRAAAERPGAPLCGNRLWVENGSIRAQRSVNGQPQTDALVAVTSPVQSMYAFHGGKRLYFLTDEGENFLKWDSATRGWIAQTLPSAELDSLIPGSRHNQPPIGAPTHLSLLGMSHERDSVVDIEHVPNGVEVRLRNLANGGTRSLPLVPFVPATSSTAAVCHRRTRRIQTTDFQCAETIAVGTEVSRSASASAYAPRGDRILVAVSELQTSRQIVGDWYFCPGQPDTMYAQPGSGSVQVSECRDFTVQQRTIGATVYSVPTRGSTAAAFPSIPGFVGQLSVGDGSEEFVMQRRDDDVTITYKLIPKFFSGPNAFVWQLETVSATVNADACETQFRRLQDAGLEARHSGCEYGGATLAPNRIAATRAVRAGNQQGNRRFPHGNGAARPRTTTLRRSR